jgi:TonB family protein
MFELAERRKTRPSKGAVAGSIVLHVTLVVGMLAGALRSDAADEFEYKVYKVDLYSPPPQQLGQPEPAKSESKILRPQPVNQPTVVDKKPAPVTPPKKTATPTSGKSDVAKGRNPDPKSVVGGEGIDVKIDGAEFSDPEYLENILVQIHRHLRWSGAKDIVAVVNFEILRDGSVRRVRIAQKSGNFNFDLAAVTAIEEVGKRKLFGPLPKSWVLDRLPVSQRIIAQ